ncbi:hypothetical protein [Campylobacter ureolyticus]|uniref:Membrane protein n=1 Tax=Campylobacter ureolyticus TaxID=827 RepID=A0AAE7JPB0_9BACT|nr:hypothetical protein [Campylobacter ureolyticus]MCR8684610.1 LapA family protein [Campylobacter ureolyticus]QKF84100.1 putative membrane protein [Campylobacter ureolyticus]QQY35754.1 LapA family protein [Campylobacter ureolyticus]SUX24059.1 FdhC protein [Campylobacter ureolyticus]
MRLKHFIVYSLIYIGLVGIFAFVQNASSYKVSLLGVGLELPVALWFVLPIIIFAILAIFHVAWSGIANFRQKQAIKSDEDIYENYAKEILLGIESDKKFKTDTFKTSNEITKFLSPWHTHSVNIENEDISEIINVLEKLKNGEVVELKKYKLNNDNPLVIQNEFNKLQENSSYASEILKNKKALDDELSKKAYEVALKTFSYFDIKKFPCEISKDDAFLLFERYAKEENFEMTKDDLLNLLIICDLDKYGYVNVAKSLNKKIEPDVLIALFNKLNSEKESASYAYLYLLYEFGMMEELKDILNYSDEYPEFEILMDLRDQGKNISANYFFR